MVWSRPILTWWPAVSKPHAREVAEKTYVLARVEQRATLPYNNVARYHVLVCVATRQGQLCVPQTIGHTPENFLTPRRFPGEPPWLWTVPPARLVDVRIAPEDSQHNVEAR